MPKAVNARWNDEAILMCTPVAIVVRLLRWLKKPARNNHFSSSF